MTSFENLPQTPFQEFVLHFFGSERGLLATPTQCGTYPVNSTFSPWDESVSTSDSTQFFILDSWPERRPLPARGRGPSHPSFEAGTEDNTAGVTAPRSGCGSPATTAIRTSAGSTVATPPGFLRQLRGIPYCPRVRDRRARTAGYTGQAELASPACPAASQIGTAITGVGAGTHPLYTPGKVYLAGPYKGAPLSLVVVVPAVSGPYDLGNVAVRVALQVDPTTAQITAVSDPLPQILDGHPAAAALDPDQPRPAELRAQPDELRTLLGRRDRSPADQGAQATVELRPSRSPTARTSATGPSSA